MVALAVSAGHSTAPAPPPACGGPCSGRQCAKPVETRRWGRVQCSAAAPIHRPVSRLADAVTVREPDSNEELERAAIIRANSYYEAVIPTPRFADSLAKQMAGNEYRALHKRTAIQENGRPCCICLVAVGPDGCICGSLDLRLPEEATGQLPPGVPEGDSGGAFLVNVAVDQRFRGQGVGCRLISAAVRTAARRLMAKRLYTHVDCNNEAAWRLYQQQGFDIYDDAACSLPGGRLILVTHLNVN